MRLNPVSGSYYLDQEMLDLVFKISVEGYAEAREGDFTYKKLQEMADLTIEEREAKMKKMILVRGPKAHITY
jgi:hypothetical protein